MAGGLASLIPLVTMLINPVGTATSVLTTATTGVIGDVMKVAGIDPEQYKIQPGPDQAQLGALAALLGGQGGGAGGAGGAGNAAPTQADAAAAKLAEDQRKMQAMQAVMSAQRIAMDLK